LTWDKQGNFKGLANLTTSGLFCVLLIAAPLFKTYHDSILEDSDESQEAAAETYTLPSKLKKVLSVVYFCPNQDADTKDEQDYVYGMDNCKPLQYFSDIQSSCEEYLKSIMEYHKKGGRLSYLLDKPNSHRLLELAVQTIPMFKHALIVSELVLEMVHRVFKNWLETNPNPDAHISGVEIALARDWSSRLLVLYKIWKYSNDREEKRKSFVGLKRLLLGAAAIQIDDNSNFFGSFIERFKQHVESTFREPIPKQMEGNSHVTFLPIIKHYWTAGKQIDEEHITHDMKEGIRLVSSYYQSTDSNAEIEIRLCAAARLMKQEQFSEPRGTYEYNTVYIIDNSGEVLVMQMTSAVRRACAIHVCSASCCVRTEGLRVVVVHDEDVKQYQIAAAKSGFPPHMG